jgi:hypothetical protein
MRRWQEEQQEGEEEDDSKKKKGSKADGSVTSLRRDCRAT